MTTPNTGGLRRRTGWLVAAALMALSIAASIAIDTPAATAATVDVTLQCRSKAPIIGDRLGTQSLQLTSDAPAQVRPGAELTINITSPPDRIASAQDGGKISGIKNLSLKIPVPPNSTLVRATLSGGQNLGPTPPTITIEGTQAIMRVPGPIAADTTYQVPQITLALKATGADGQSIALRLGGTSYDDPGFTTTALLVSPISADVPTTCYPSAPNPALSTTDIVEIDTTPPTIALNTPADGAQYPKDSRVRVSFQCNDGPRGSGIASCIGASPDGATLDTSKLGAFSFTVTATDKNGNQATASSRYQIIPSSNDRTPPTITIASPVDGAVFVTGATATATFSCADADSGVSTCQGTVPTGAALDMSIGPHLFVVTAQDNDGNPHAVSASYRVLPGAGQQDFNAGGPSGLNRIPVDCDTLFGAFNESIPLTDANANVVASQVGVGGTFTWTVRIGRDTVPALVPAATNVQYRFAKPQNAHFVAAALLDGGENVSGVTAIVQPDGKLLLRIASTTGSFFSTKPFRPPALQMTLQADGVAGTAVTTQLEYFELTTVVTTRCPAGDPSDREPNPILTTTAIVDVRPPQVNLTSPAHARSYAPGTRLAMGVTCTDDAPTGLACASDPTNGTALDTASSGTRQVSATATDAAGNVTKRFATYVVDDPQVIVADAATVGEAGSSALRFTVTLSNPSRRTIAVSYTTVDGSANAGEDYTRTSGALRFEPGGPLSQPVVVAVVDDGLHEDSESVTLALVSALNATVGRATASGSIVDDDPVPPPTTTPAPGGPGGATPTPAVDQGSGALTPGLSTGSTTGRSGSTTRTTIRAAVTATTRATTRGPSSTVTTSRTTTTLVRATTTFEGASRDQRTRSSTTTTSSESGSRAAALGARGASGGSSSWRWWLTAVTAAVIGLWCWLFVRRRRDTKA